MTKNADEVNICSRIERLINEYEQTRESDSTEISRQFTQLQRMMIENKEHCPCIEGTKPSNRQKNRYKDVLPYDKYRVILQSDNESDYINASFVEDIYNDRRYIAAQGPIDESVTDFIRMIWEFQITSVICTANDIEAGRLKFRRYWPEDEKFLQFGCYRISKDETSDKGFICEDYKILPLVITQGENRRYILLYHFLRWLDHDIPNDEAPIYDLLLRLDADRHVSPDTPILVHCSAGCGRTGSIIAIDLLRLLLRDERLFLSKDYQPYPVFKIATFIRQFRIALIQTTNQYFFVHKMLIYMMKANGVISLCSPINYDENQIHSSTKSSPSSSSNSSSSRRSSGASQIKLCKPRVGHSRRQENSTNTNNNNNNNDNPSQTVNSSIQNPTSIPEQPPPIPPRSSLGNTTNKPIPGQWTRPGITPIKAPRTIFRSRHVKRRDPNSPLINIRSDSADALSAPSLERCQRNSIHQLQVHDEQATNSD